MNVIKSIFILCLSFFVSFATLANENVENKIENKNEIEQVVSERGQVVLNVIKSLQDSGYITEKNAKEAKVEFVLNKNNLDKIIKENQLKDNSVDSSTSTIMNYVNTVNLFKILGIVALLIAFKGFLVKIVLAIVNIPVVFYQILLMSASIFGTFYSEMIWASEAYYLSLFFIVSNILILGWIYSEKEEFWKKVFSYISLNMNPIVVVSFYLTLYFGFFTLQTESVFLSVLTLIAFESMFGFMIVTIGLTTYIGYEEDDYIGFSFIVNALLLTLYCATSIMAIEIPYFDLFSVAIAYISSIVFTVTLLIKSSFYFMDEKGFWFYVLITLLVSFGSMFGGSMYNLEIIPAVINTGFVIFISSWICYLTSTINGILTTAVIGVLLYGSALLMEKYPELFIMSIF